MWQLIVLMMRGAAASKATAIRRRLHSSSRHRRSSSSYAISAGQWRYAAERKQSNCQATSGSVLAAKAFNRASQVSQPTMFIARNRNQKDRVKGVHGRA
jgi:hypothetical protein